MYQSSLTLATIALLFTSFVGISNAAPGDFETGPALQNYGENTEIVDGLLNPESQHFKVVFDVYEENIGESPHRGFNSAARFINMHVRAGVPVDNINVAIVVHGKASYQLMNDKAFFTKFEKENPSSDLVSKLLENDVDVFVCGQSASFLGLQAKQFNDQVKVSLSAMTANALLQQAGYTLNPF